MALIDTTKLEICLKFATEAKELRDEAQKIEDKAQAIEEKAVESFRQVRKEMLETVQNEKNKLEKEMEDLRTKYFKEASTFCNQNGHHTGIERKVNASNIPLRHTFIRGYVYPTVTYTTCFVCGYCNDPIEQNRLAKIIGDICIHNENVDVILKASLQTENLELKETAQRILEIQEQLKILDNKLKENHKGFEEICFLFGHDIEEPRDRPKKVKCKCCGKEMGYREYSDDNDVAKYKGGIVTFYYADKGGHIL